jgi:glycosyltransferase involved in cell wall biosynthesis
MRIVYLITRMDRIGGAQIHVRDLSLWLRQNGHDPVVLTGAMGAICGTLIEEGVSVIQRRELVGGVRPVKDVRAILDISRILKELAPDLVSCHLSKAGILGRIIASSMGIPVIFTAHGWGFTEGSKRKLPRIVHYQTERLGGALCDHIVTVSHHDRRLALEAKIAPASRITTIHNGISVLPPVRRTANAPGPVRIGMVGRLGAQRDHETLLRALARLRHKNWQLHLIGGGNSTVVVRAASELGLLDRIQLHGECFDVPALLAGLDVFCLISRRESFPRSVLEAMRAGLPVVASDLAGIRESIEDGVNGYLAPVGDDRLVAKSLEDLMDLPGLRVAMGNRGRLKFERTFTLGPMCRSTLDLYRAAIADAASERNLPTGQGGIRSLVRFRGARW